MKRSLRKLPIILALLLALAACGQAEEEAPPEEAAPEELETPMEPELPAEGDPIRPALLEGEARSPDGRFLARVEGHREGIASGGPYPAEKVQITDAETGEVLWEGDGAYTQSILWSPEGGFAALAREARTWCSVTVVETAGWTSWDFALPDGSPIPEYTALPYGEPWGAWQSKGSLDLTIGRGGDAGEQRFYTCAVVTRDGSLQGTVWEESREPLPGSYDFDHDGEPEIAELVEVYGDEAQHRTGWYELRVRTPDNRLYWSRSRHVAHPGWGSYFACRVDGADYLLRYEPVMYQGLATYAYQLFSLGETGEEQILREGSVEFDVNFGSPVHAQFDPGAIAAFLETVRGFLEDSELLLTTESGEFRSGGPGAEFRDDLEFWTGDPLYDGGKSLEENIRMIGEYWQEMRTAA